MGRKTAAPANSNAVAYVRVSTEEQAREGISLEAQTERVQAYCKMAGLKLVDVLRDEGVSAGKKLIERPAGAQLAAMIEAGNASHVVALKLDRLFRDAVNCLETASAWDASGTALHLVDIGGQTVNTRSASGRFLLSVMAAAAEMERNMGRERTATALQHKKANGTRLGKPPLGFKRRMPASGDDLIPHEMDAVRTILRLRQRKMPLRAIAAELTAARYRTKTGAKWSAEIVRSVWQRRDEYRRAMKLSKSAMVGSG